MPIEVDNGSEGDSHSTVSGVSNVLPVELVEETASDDVLGNAVGRNPGNNSEESEETREEHVEKSVNRTC